MSMYLPLAASDLGGIVVAVVIVIAIISKIVGLAKGSGAGKTPAAGKDYSADKELQDFLRSLTGEAPAPPPTPAYQPPKPVAEPPPPPPRRQAVAADRHATQKKRARPAAPVPVAQAQPAYPTTTRERQVIGGQYGVHAIGGDEPEFRAKPVPVAVPVARAATKSSERNDFIFRVLRERESLRTVVLLNEIIGPPLALRTGSRRPAG